jgi:hypothetical protein
VSLHSPARNFELVDSCKKLATPTIATQSARKQSVRHAELGGVSEAQIRRAGRWNTDAMTGVYLSYLPRGLYRRLRTFHRNGNPTSSPGPGRRPRRPSVDRYGPKPTSGSSAWRPITPDCTDNEVVRLDLAGSGFLRLLRALRVVLLQDSVILRQRFPLHPLWVDPLFDSEEYRRFAARVEASLVDVVNPRRTNDAEVLAGPRRCGETETRSRDFWDLNLS